MDDLKHLLEHTESVELPSGHLNRFEKKMGFSVHNSRFTSQNLIYLSVAASIAVIFSLFAILGTDEQEKPTNLIFAQEEQELIETEVYLQYTINQKLDEIYALKIKSDKKTILKDISEMDETLKALEKDYNEIPGDSRIINAVIITYMKKIEALDNIKFILQKNS